MLIDGKDFQVLNLDDINSLISLEGWVKDSLTIYNEDQKIDIEQLKVFVDFIRHKVKEQRLKNKREWLDRLDELSDWADNPRRDQIGERDEG